jgi:hypothetical protein
LPPELTTARFNVIYTNEDFVTINKVFPHLGKKIAFLWGSPEFYPFMHALQYDESRTDRHGFPPEVLMAAHQLTQTHSKLHPQLIPRQTDIWTQQF